jgi:hypothetical protein
MLKVLLFLNLKYLKSLKKITHTFQGFEGLLAESKLNIELNILLTLFNKVEEGF